MKISSARDPRHEHRGRKARQEFPDFRDRLIAGEMLVFFDALMFRDVRHDRLLCSAIPAVAQDLQVLRVRMEIRAVVLQRSQPGRRLMAKAIGILLIVAGLVGLLYGGVCVTTRGKSISLPAAP